ncbi:MAG: hypothetical protein KA807_13185 [Prolixibacteraceae bacterium]|nr:hypothetical protein [Prolixibacteraceae bacterium]
MKKGWKYIIALSVIGLIVAAIVSLYVFRKSDNSVAGKKPDFKVLCSEIVNEFESDEQSASTKYVDKIVEVEGVIAEISSDEESYVIILKDPDSFSGVSCSISKEEIKEDEIGKAGDKIKIKGICTGYLMDVTLIKGALSD